VKSEAGSGSKQVLVLGAGAVGGYLGGRLALAGHSVTLAGRSPAGEAIRRHGLIIEEGQSRQTAHVQVHSSLRQAMLERPAYDLVLVATKAYDAQGAMNELVAFYPGFKTLVTLQNGIGIEEMFAAEFGPDRLVAGSLTTPLSREASQEIVVERADRGLALAPMSAAAAAKEVADLFTGAGLETATLADYRSMKWSKALLNMVGNATSAILNRHPRVIYAYRPTFRLEMAMLREVLKVMKAEGLRVTDLPGTDATGLALATRLPGLISRPFLGRAVAAGRGRKMPSFHMDLAAGKRQNEVLYHNGAVAAAGKAAGIPTPVNQALNDILLQVAHGETDYQRFNGKPDALVEAVASYQQQAGR
jgi:2-dehydropantoate 2-reductase